MHLQPNDYAEQNGELGANIVDENTTLLPQGCYSGENHDKNKVYSALHKDRSSWRSLFIFVNLTGITVTSSVATGLLTVGIPGIAKDLALPDHLLLWPLSAYALTSGSCLLVAGTVADLTDSKLCNVAGTIVLGLSMITAGCSPNGYWLIGARAAQGLGVAMIMPTGVIIITSSFPPGRQRNMGFSYLGLAAPIGFSFGLVIGGLLQESAVGWRFGFWTCGAISMIFAVSNLFVVPSGMFGMHKALSHVVRVVDWMGVLLSSSSLVCFTYWSAILTYSFDDAKNPGSITLLLVAILLFLTFFVWMHRQGKTGRVALIPNSLWRKRPFLAISLIVLLQWAVTQSMEVYYSLFFQNIQGLSPSQVSIRFIPGIILGIILSLCTGRFVHCVRIDVLVATISSFAAASPLLLAISDPTWPYYTTIFWSILFTAVSIDVVFTIAHLIVIDVFPPDMHGLAGAVFNVVAQLGASTGLAVMSVVSSMYTQSALNIGRDSAEALLYGYRAVSWAGFFFMCLSCLMAPFGLRTVGRLGST